MTHYSSEDLIKYMNQSPKENEESDGLIQEHLNNCVDCMKLLNEVLYSPDLDDDFESFILDATEENTLEALQFYKEDAEWLIKIKSYMNAANAVINYLEHGYTMNLLSPEEFKSEVSRYAEIEPIRKELEARASWMLDEIMEKEPSFMDALSALIIYVKEFSGGMAIKIAQESFIEFKRLIGASAFETNLVMARGGDSESIEKNMVDQIVMPYLEYDKPNLKYILHNLPLDLLKESESHDVYLVGNSNEVKGYIEGDKVVFQIAQNELLAVNTNYRIEPRLKN